MTSIASTERLARYYRGVACTYWSLARACPARDTALRSSIEARALECQGRAEELEAQAEMLRLQRTPRLFAA